MATKNMSRTVIEGGRVSSNKIDRYESNRIYRAQSRDFARKSKSLSDPDDLGPYPKRYEVRKEFGDKLGPLNRWLRSQVGKKWDQVFSELVTKFDTRTTSGRHVVYSHLLGNITLNVTDVEHLQERGWFRNDYYVDEDGLLQRHTPKRRVKSFWKREQELQIWAGNRKVMDYGVSVFWMNPTRTDWARCDNSLKRRPCFRKHRMGTYFQQIPGYDLENTPTSVPNVIPKTVVEGGFLRTRYYKKVPCSECLQGFGRYVQGDKFSAEDLNMWKSMTDAERYDLLWVKPEEPRKR